MVTNDGATILKQLEVQHPAAKVLVDLSDLQVNYEAPSACAGVGLLRTSCVAHGYQCMGPDPSFSFFTCNGL